MKTFLNRDSKTFVIIKSLLFWILFIGLLILSSVLLVPFFPPSLSRFAYGTFGTFSAFITTWCFLKYEKRNFRDIGLKWERHTLLRFFYGLLVGGIIFLFVMIFLIGFSALEIHKNIKPVSLAAIAGYLVIFPLALMEEVAFRSYPFLKLNKAFGLRFTQIIIAFAFVVYHIINGWDISIAFAGPGIWAFVFGLAAIWSGGIALPTGIHVALNILQTISGIKAGEGSWWILKYKEGTSVNEMQKAEITGFVTQLLILIIAVLLTEWYIRKKRIASGIDG